MLQTLVNVTNHWTTVSWWVTVTHRHIYGYKHMAYALLFGDMNTRSIAVGQIILSSTVPKSVLWNCKLKISWLYIYIYIYIYIYAYGTWLIYSDMFTRSMLAEQIGFGSTLFKHQFHQTAWSWWLAFTCMCVYMHVAHFLLFTDMVTAMLRERSNFDQLYLNINFIDLQVQDDLPWCMFMNVHRTQGHVTCGLLRLWSTLWENLHHLRLEICDVNVTIKKIIWDWIQFISYWCKKDKYTYNTWHVFGAKLWSHCGYRLNGDRYYEVVKWYNLCPFVTFTDGHLRP